MGTEKPWNLIGETVARKLGQLQNNPLEPAVRAELAKLRKGLGKKPGELPELWGSLFLDMPQQLEGRGQEASPAEWAIYTALTLYAMHQQGRSVKDDNMNRRGQSLGSAVAMLALHEKSSEEAIQRRYNAMATAVDINELVWHLKGIIQLLRQRGLPIDYVELAGELYQYQDLRRRTSVRLNWGRDFYRKINEMKQKADKEEEENHE